MGRRHERPEGVTDVYRARLAVGEGSAEVSFQPLPDPCSSASIEDLQAQLDLLIEARVVLTEAHTAIVDLRTIRSQLNDLAARLGDGEATEPLRASIDQVQEVLTSVEETLYQTKNESRQDLLNFPIQLTDKLSGVKGVIGSGDFAPTAQARAVQAELVAAIRADLARLSEVRESALPAINAVALELAVPAVGGE